MNTDDILEIFLVSVPGLETVLCEEATEKGFREPVVVSGGVTIAGDWRDVWRANLEIRGASRILVRMGAFRALHLAQLDKRARKFPWADTLRPDVPLRVEVSCKASRIYHKGAAAQRIERAIAEEFGASISAEAEVSIKVRIHDDLCTISVDSSGEALHKRDHKVAVSKAPMRETMASLFLRQCGYTGNEPVVDPMCGSGTFVIEAAEIASGLNPGRTRNFAFEKLVGFDPAAWEKLKGKESSPAPDFRFYGSDRDPGAVRMSRENAKRAGVEDFTGFQELSINDVSPPEGPAGLVIINPPYGTRIGEVKSLKPLYQALGQVLKSRFSGWRVGLITSADPLAKSTGLPFSFTSGPVSHGGINIKLYTTDPLA
ncbi:class I SAM-dependent RNA methyltransferase [Kiloniella laminariae]|uniref:Class I SAM-dependent RNA methyltransferase n=1 Tax=Kiloniella laminariae TaxID=454162 RepID=A0ABT4LGU1_9PROT|nr:class I SAM-dependent RNA methyltransferase [Kiloniella laminariae]MCZ4280326.1 class I SAM-dependent RNA methyltransferase [Kiloniella laminariae]